MGHRCVVVDWERLIYQWWINWLIDSSKTKASLCSWLTQGHGLCYPRVSAPYEQAIDFLILRFSRKEIGIWICYFDVNARKKKKKLMDWKWAAMMSAFIQCGESGERSIAFFVCILLNISRGFSIKVLIKWETKALVWHPLLFLAPPSSNPQTSEVGESMGWSALSRAFSDVRDFAMVALYKLENMSYWRTLYVLVITPSLLCQKSQEGTGTDNYIVHVSA